jgi:capsular polysaccharide transport system permease protein
MNSLTSTFRVWGALMLRDIGLRAPGSRFGYILDLVQPFFQLGMMYGVFYNIGRVSDFGPSLFIFLFSGVFPYFLFTHTTARVMTVYKRARAFAPLHRFGTIDLAIALVILETLTVVVMGAGALLIGGAFGLPNSEPYNLPQLILSVVTMSFLALGVGLFNTCLVEYFGAWRLLWSVIARSLIFFSNVFYVVDFLPPVARHILFWNPVLHGVIWFRVGLYPNYPTSTFSPAYMIGFSITALLIGMTMERILRKTE